METIQYSKIGEEDLQVGRGTFEVVLGDGRTVAMPEVNLDSFDKLLSEDDATASDTATLLTLRHTTTGTPAAGIGASILLQAESTDESPSDLASIEGAFDDVTAASEDSTFYIRLRRAGAALSRAFGFRNTGNFNLLFSAALTAARTWTLQDATDTLVGRATTDTLSNKTLTDALHNAGTGTETFRANGHIAVDLTAASTAANVTETDLISYSLPLNTLSANSLAVRIRAWGTSAANANTKTIRLYFGNSVVFSNNISQAPNGAAWLFEADVFRTSASTQDVIAHGSVGHFPQTTVFNIATEDLTAAVIIKITGQNGVANATEITAEGLSVEFLNG